MSQVHTYRSWFTTNYVVPGEHGVQTVQILLCVLPGSARENGTRFVGNETLLEGIYKFINNPPGNSENLIHDTCNRTLPA